MGKIHSIEELLNRFHLSPIPFSLINEALTFLESQHTEDFAGKPAKYACGVYKIFEACQILISDGEQIFSDGKVSQELLLTVYRNVRQIATGKYTNGEDLDGNLAILFFLGQLEIYGKNGDVKNVKDDFLERYISLLLKDLKDIQFLFELREEKRLVFPIHRLIAKIIEGADFITCSQLDSYKIQILQLAVRLFETDAVEKKRLKEIQDQCNLVFLEYLINHSDILDTQELLNYSKNHIMVFYDRFYSKVLIRSDEKKYFAFRPVSHTDLQPEIQKETDFSRTHVIGYFVELEIDPDDTLISYETVLASEQGREAFLHLVYDEDIRNVLWSDSILQTPSNELFPLNPYCGQDEFLICSSKNNDSDEPGAVSSAALPQLLKKYFRAPVKQDRLNILTFGLCVNLLEHYNCGVDVLGLSALSAEDWYQNQAIKNWVTSGKDKQEILGFVLQKCFKDLGACADLKAFENHVVTQEQCFLPYQMDWSWASSIIDSAFTSKTMECFEGIVLSDSAGKYLNCSSIKDSEMLHVDKLADSDGLLDEAPNGSTIYFLYDVQDEKGIVENQRLLKALYGVTHTLREDCLLKKSVQDNIRQADISLIQEKMSLFDNFFKTDKNFFSTFDLQLFRIIYNLIWSEITPENLSAYIDIIRGQEILSFEKIASDQSFHREEPGTLYVPKDDEASDGTLLAIYQNYLKNTTVREERSLYDQQLGMRDGQYTFRGEIIKKILFLFDNFEYGNGTIAAVKAYVGSGIGDGLKNSRQKYLYNNQVVTLSQIFSANRDLKISISQVVISG